jgi:hypothetical protein
MNCSHLSSLSQQILTHAYISFFCGIPVYKAFLCLLALFFVHSHCLTMQLADCRMRFDGFQQRGSAEVDFDLFEGCLVLCAVLRLGLQQPTFFQDDVDFVSLQELLAVVLSLLAFANHFCCACSAEPTRIKFLSSARRVLTR